MSAGDRRRPIDPRAGERSLLRGRFAPPPRPAPTPSPPDPLAELLAGYDQGITTLQSPSEPVEVDGADWQPCHACGARIPVELHGTNTITAITYVCPRCHATQLGERLECDAYERCHECKTPLAGADACPRCGLLRGWVVVACSSCRGRQAVFAPHLGSGCDAFHLECVTCGRDFYSYCIC